MSFTKIRIDYHNKRLVEYSVISDAHFLIKIDFAIERCSPYPKRRRVIKIVKSRRFRSTKISVKRKVLKELKAQILNNLCLFFHMHFNITR